METIIQSTITKVLDLAYQISSFFIRLWLVPLNSILEWGYNKLVPLVTPLLAWFNRNKKNILKISGYAILLVVVAAFLSGGSMLLVYSNRVSKIATETPLFFDFSHQNINSKKSNNLVMASADISAELHKQRIYDIYLELDLPESPKNMEMGMFMVCMTITNNDKWNPNRINSNCKPATMKYASPTLKNIKNYVNAVPFLFGLYEEKQTLVIQMIENLMPTKYYHSISVEVNIMNSDIQIYEAKLKTIANLSGLEYYIFKYPVTMFVIGYCLFFVMWLSAMIFTVISIYLYRYFKSLGEEVVPELSDREEELDQFLRSPSPPNPLRFSSDSLPFHSGFNQPVVGDASSSSTVQHLNKSSPKLSALSSSRSKLAWEVDNDDDDIDLEYFNNPLNNNLNNNNMLGSNDGISEFLENEQKKYEQELEKKLKSQVVDATINETIVDNIEEEREIISPIISSSTNSTENLNSSTSSQVPQAIIDEDNSSTSDSFTPIPSDSSSDEEGNGKEKSHSSLRKRKSS